MTRGKWHMFFDSGVLVHTRRIPARFDVMSETVLVGGGGFSVTRIARQVRQDVWRALRAQRGFSPVIHIAIKDANLSIKAGGQIDGVFSRPRLEMILRDILNDPARRTRWANYARRST